MVAIFVFYAFGLRFGFVVDGWRLSFDFSRQTSYSPEYEEVDFYAWEQEEEMAQVADWEPYDEPASAAETAFVAELEEAEVAAEWRSRPLSPYHF